MQCVVPSLAHDSLAVASKSLRKARCRLGKVTHPRGHDGVLVVTAQGYKRGTKLAQGTAVAVVLGPKPRHGR